ncbi:MAG: response regulator [Burkholderiaceae bacterium]|nr:response regulator [Burkholderiaceae bacterium]
MAHYLRRLVWLAILPLVLLAMLLAADTLRRLRAADDRSGHLLATQLSRQFAELVHQRTMGLEVLAASPLLDEGRLADFHRRAQVFPRQFGNALLLTDGQGQMLLHTGVPFGQPLPPLPKPSGRAAAPAALASKQAEVGDVFMGPIAKVPLVAVAVPVLRDGKAQRLLLTTIDARIFQAQIDQAELPDGWHVTLLDSRQAVIAGGFGAGANATAVDNGGRRFTQAMGTAPWTLHVDESAAARRGPLLTTLAGLLVAIGVATAVGRLGSGVGGRRLSSAVAQLALPGESRASVVAITEIESARETIDAAVGEQRRLLLSMQEASQRFATLFESAPVAMVVGALADRRLTEVNGAFEALTGHVRGDVLGRPSDDLDLWVDPAIRNETILRLQRHASTPVVQAQLRRRGGDVIDVSFSSCRVEIAGRPHFVAMIVDTTPLQEARRALERQQVELEALVARRTADLEAANATLLERAAAISALYDGAPCGYHSLAPDGTISAVNATELEMLGYAREEFIGQPVARFMTPASRALVAQRYAALMVAGSVREVEFDFVRKDGSVLPVLVSAVSVRDASGRHVSNRAVMLDNSERKKREQQITAMQAELARRADDAEAANRAKSAFLANMSHEIRTPMNAIIGLTHLLARDATQPLQRNRLAKVDGAAKHLLQVINDILDLSKIEAGKLVLEDTEFDLDDLLAKAFALVEGTARAKGLELVLDTDHTPSRLRGDPTRLSQALVNLLANAVKFTSTGWVRLAVAPVAREGDVVMLRFEVRDTGEGIAAEAIPHLFDAFEQADSSTTRRHGGTGLGLALSRHVARMMGGDMGVDSQPGVGSSFWLTAQLRAAAAPAQETGMLPLAGGHALLVDDLQEALQSLRDQLRMLGMTVSAFASPQAALQAAADEASAGRSFDLVVLDWRMGPPDGLDLLGLLRQVRGLSSTPAVLVTAHDDDTLQRQAQAAGFEALLVKPITASALHDTLQRLRRGASGALRPFERPDPMGALLRTHHAGRRVLLAEDNAINREVAMELLSSVGLVVEVAEDGLQAVEMALSGNFDLVLMDMQMPELDGLDATRRLRAGGQGSLPIVAMTANAFGEDRTACLAAGMNDHLAKPVDPERLYATLHRWLPQRGPAPVEPSGAAPNALPMTSVAPLHDRLATIEGLDIAQAMVNVGGNFAILRRVLERFVQTYVDGTGPMTRELAHSMRGACAAIGAVEVHAAVHAYELAAGRADADTHADELRQLAQVVAHGLSTLTRRLQEELGRHSA